MSLKLRCVFPVALKYFKSPRILLLAQENVSIRNPIKQINTCGVIGQYRWNSTRASSKDTGKDKERQKSPVKRIYYGNLAPHVKAVKIFSISSSIVGLTVQPLLYKEIVATGNVPIILAAYTFIGFFTVVTPLLLHLITRKYITEINYNEETGTYTAKTLNLFCATKETEFKPEDVHIPDIPGMFVTFHVKGKPLFADPRHFNHPQHYAKLMGFDKPIDFKLYDKQSDNNGPTPSTTSSSNK